MSCPHCGSENVKKNGLLPSGKQRWYCNDCKKYWSFGVEPVKPTTDGKHCPYCGGALKSTGWNASGTRRYACKECGKRCSGENPTKSLPVHSEIPCPYCGTHNARKLRQLKDGTKRYQCNECGKGFSANTVISKPVNLTCPSCGGKHIHRSGHDTATGKQRYKCADCNRKFVENPTQCLFQKHEKECPSCHHIGAKKAGKSNGKQYYICLNCNTKFLEGGTRRHIRKTEKERILQMMKQGITRLDIAKELNISVKTIYNFLSKCEEYRHIAERHKQLQNERAVRNERLEHLYKIKEKKVQRFMPYNRIPYGFFYGFMKLAKQYLAGELKKTEFDKMMTALTVKEFEKVSLTREELIYKQNKKKACMAIMRGMSTNYISRYNVTMADIKASLQTLYKNEKLTPEQEDTIVKFGVGCRVPVEYLAPYVPCSQRLCRNILKNYTIPAPKKHEVSEHEKAFDKIWLDKFLGG